MSKISTYDELLQEKQRLKLLLSEREMALRTEFEDIKTKLQPVNRVLEFTQKLMSKDTNNPLVNAGIDVGVNFLLKKVLLRNASWIAKFLAPIFVSNYLSHEVSEHPNWLKKLIGFVRKKFG
jgi:hypothetical protein